MLPLHDKNQKNDSEQEDAHIHEAEHNQNIPLENEYGNSNMHVMEDRDGNVFIWTTASKNWPEGSKKLIRGTVKSHRLYRGVKQTILIRCSERGTLNG